VTGGRPIRVSNYIWNISSSYNVRSSKPKPANDYLLRSIQKYFLKPTKSLSKEKNDGELQLKTIVPDSDAKRISFLILFGTKYKVTNKEVVIAGTIETPVRVKVSNEWTFNNSESLLNAYPKKTINLAAIDPPIGFKWTKNLVETKIRSGIPYVDSTSIPMFDGSSLLKSITPKTTQKPSKSLAKLILTILSGLDVDFQTLLNLRSTYSDQMLNWLPKASHVAKLDFTLLKLAYTKIFNQFNNIIMIGPVDRSGNKMQNSINYVYEGKLWAVFSLFFHLYPNTFKTNGTLNFLIKKETPGYVDLINRLRQLLFIPVPVTGTIPSITTLLWDHQLDSSKKILGGFRNNRYGLGDASQVGSGKTLTSLSVAVELIKTTLDTYSGILVMLPGNKLIKTWSDEITKHTNGFDVVFQEHTAEIGPIKRNTIVVTTMGRIRDHPINHTWLLIIIDECLSVQNKNALWTESAWAQSMMSKHLVMMSATFFRTRFDKLYYMLKMLRTGLPEQREYLDAILLESIVSQVSSISRNWTSNFNYFILDDTSRKAYNKINTSSLSTEAKFSKLTSLLTSNEKVREIVVKQLSKLIEKLHKKKSRCLIYARAMDEAKYWSEYLDIPIYPAKGRHCIVTYNDGTYGLNDLVIYDTLVMRPPAPDKLPQIKGRLDRPNQKSNDLSIEYFVIKDTIEMGLILRMNIASEFIHKYIMPLSQFYDISVNYEKYLDDADSE